MQDPTSALRGAANASASTWPDFSEPGTMLLGAYEVLARFRGGFGIVLHVVESATGRPFAVKVPKLKAADTAQAYSFFTSEVEFWLKLPPHPNIVQAHFVSKIEDRPALFMEYVEGRPYSNLAQWLAIESVPESTALDLAHQLCVAMEFANRGGEIAHRDLKPQNLLISGESCLKVSDFGSAVRVEVQGDTYPKVTSGSWPYAAPEMLRREIADSRSDIYSFGMIVVHMLTGQLPYPFQLDSNREAWATQLATFYKSKKFRSSYGLGRDLSGCSNHRMAQIVGMCLAPEPSERPRDFAQLLELMNSALGLSATVDPYAPLTAERLFDVAVNLRRLGRYDAALSKLNLLLVKYPDHPRRSEFFQEVAENLKLNGSPHPDYFEKVASRLSKPLSRS